MVDIPIVKPEEMSQEEISALSEDVKKEERRRKKLEKEYVFSKADIEELSRRLAAGEDIEDATRDISKKGIISLPTIPTPPIIPIKPIIAIQPEPSEPLTEREKKERKKILRSEEQRIDYPEEECCAGVCDTLNKEIEPYIGIVSPDKDTKLKFNALIELRRQFYIQDACQCANGHAEQKSGIPLREKQTEDCCPKTCEILNGMIDEYEGILLPTHNIRIISETLYDIRSKMHKNACECVESEELLKKPVHGGPPIDPMLQIKLGKLLKFAERQGWIK